jgi:hypothetical protein
VFTVIRGSVFQTYSTNGSWLLNGFSPAYRLAPGAPHPYTLGQALRLCQRSQMLSCYRAHGVQVGFLIQPPSHFWSLQWGEFTAYLVAAVALAAVTVWAVRRWRA